MNLDLNVKILSSRLSAVMFAISVCWLGLWGGQAAAQNLVVVNGKALPMKYVDALLAREASGSSEEEKKKLHGMLREDFVRQEVLAQEAQRSGLGNSIEVKMQIEFTTQAILVRALHADFKEKNKMPAAELTIEYENYVKTRGAGDRQFRARHILVDDEKTAKAIILKLKKGAKFETEAKISKDTGSAKNGGELGWADAKAFVAPFSEAMQKLAPGEVTKEPVKTEFGYHVIRLDEVRDEPVPTLDQVKPELEKKWLEKKFEEFQKELVAKAKVE